MTQPLVKARNTVPLQAVEVVADRVEHMIVNDFRHDRSMAGRPRRCTPCRCTKVSSAASSASVSGRGYVSPGRAQGGGCMTIGNCRNSSRANSPGSFCRTSVTALASSGQGSPNASRIIPSICPVLRPASPRPDSLGKLLAQDA